MAAEALKRFPFYLLALGCFHMSLAAVSGNATYCVVSATDGADLANLTCFLGEDVGRQQKTFAVFQAMGNSTLSDTVVSCNFFESHKPVCHAEKGFTAPDTVTDTAVIGVPRADGSSFYCSLIPGNPSVKPERCTLQTATPRDTQSKKRGETGWSDGYTVGIVVGVGLLAAVFVLVLVRRYRPALCRHRPKRSLSTIRNDGAQTAESGETETLTPSTDHADGQEGGPPEDAAAVAEGPSGQPSAPPGWCQCGNCREMKERVERLCCELQPCKATTPQFKAHVLDTAEAFNPTKGELLHDDVMETKRKYAYKCFVQWHHQLFQKDLKTPVPSCCVWAVRHKFPDKEDKYRGFVWGPKIVLDNEWVHKALGEK